MDVERDYYRLRPDISSKTLEVELCGFWTIAVAETYRAARDAAINRLILGGVPPHDLLIFIDARQMVAQSQDVVDSFRRTLAGSALQPRRSAMVLSSTLGVMQVRRIAMPGQRLFTDVSEAKAWLHAD